MGKSESVSEAQALSWGTTFQKPLRPALWALLWLRAQASWLALRLSPSVQP